MGRRGENIHKRKDGRWEARIICKYNSAGKAVYRSFYGKTYQEVKGKRNAWLSQSDRRQEQVKDPDQLKMTFESLISEWLDFKKGTVKASTYAVYVSTYEGHLKGQWEKLRLTEMTTDMFNTFLKEKLDCGRKDGTGGLSPKTVADMRSVITMVLDYAKSRNYPCHAVNKLFYPPGISGNVSVLSSSEQKKLEEAVFCSADPMTSGILIALYCGLRIGEICALQWTDIDFEEGILHVRKTLLRIRDLSPDAPRKTKVVIERPKTASSVRKIPVPAFLLTYLTAFSSSPEAYILTGSAAYMEPRLYLSRYKRILKAAGVQEYTFHTLRHTFATRWIDNGFDVKALSEILGHSSVKTTLQRYVHPSMESKRQQMEKLAGSIRGQDFGQDDT